MRELLCEGECIIEDGTQNVVVRYEGDVRDGEMSSNEVFLISQDALEDAENTPSFILVAFNRGRNLLRVTILEPSHLSKVWPVQRTKSDSG